MEGNQIKMREALENIAGYAETALCHTEDAHVLGYLEQIEKWAESALSAPPRHCDVGTADDQIERLYGGETCPSCRSPQMTSDGCACVREGPCALRWAQTPYEAQEGAGK